MNSGMDPVRNQALRRAPFEASGFMVKSAGSSPGNQACVPARAEAQRVRTWPST